MSKTALIILALALLVGPSTARAQVTVDVSEIKCSQFVEYKIADPKDIIIWMNGYHHGLHHSLILDTQSLLENTKKIEEYCFKHPDLLVMKAVEEVVGQTHDGLRGSHSICDSSKRWKVPLAIRH